MEGKARRLNMRLDLLGQVAAASGADHLGLRGGMRMQIVYVVYVVH